MSGELVAILCVGVGLAGAIGAFWLSLHSGLRALGSSVMDLRERVARLEASLEWFKKDITHVRDDIHHRLDAPGGTGTTIAYIAGKIPFDEASTRR